MKAAQNSSISQDRRCHTRRTPPRLPVVFDRYEFPLYFVTFCTASRRRLLANAETHTAFCTFAERGWRERGIAVGRYVIMPDHVHVFVTGGQDFNLSQWVRQLKAVLGREPKLWQRGFFDHLLRSEESYADKWEYVHRNPVRARLAARAEDWPYQGEIVAIECPIGGSQNRRYTNRKDEESHCHQRLGRGLS